MNDFQENKITQFCRKISIFGFFAQHEFEKTSYIHPEICFHQNLLPGKILLFLPLHWGYIDIEHQWVRVKG